MASFSSRTSRSSSCYRTGSSRKYVSFDSRGKPVCECGVAAVERTAKTSKNHGRAFWGCSNYKDEIDRGCGLCIFVDETPFVPSKDDDADGETLKLQATVRKKEEDIRKLLLMNGRLECIIDFKDAEILMLSRRANKLFCALIVAVVLILGMLMYG